MQLHQWGSLIHVQYIYAVFLQWLFICGCIKLIFTVFTDCNMCQRCIWLSLPWSISCVVLFTQVLYNMCITFLWQPFLCPCLTALKDSLLLYSLVWFYWPPRKGSCLIKKPLFFKYFFYKLLFAANFQRFLRVH